MGELDPISLTVYLAIDASCSYEEDCLWKLFRLILLDVLILGRDQFCLLESRAWLNLIASCCKRSKTQELDYSKMEYQLFSTLVYWVHY